jgi:capsular exopolysaccharide synthesis family protein
MSRYFEMFLREGREHELFARASTSAASANERCKGLDLAGKAQQEVIKLVQRLFLLPGADAPHMVVFCGVATGDGASWTCMRAAELLASQVEASVCVVDADLRAPVLHDYFRKDNAEGLADAIRQSRPVRSFTRRLSGSNLWLLTSGSRAGDPQAVLTSERLPSRLAELRAAFSYVLVDAPPLNIYADAPLLGKLADGVVLVVGANSTRREVVRKAKESLDSAQVRLLGAVLNKRKFSIPESLYRLL